VSTEIHIENIIKLLKRNGNLSTNEIAEALSLSPSRARAILGQMVKDGTVKAHGERRSRMYSVLQNFYK